jgi:DNA (cytosine-5)-methyltransferase 1
MPTFIEVCAGAGGLSTGLIQAGFEPVLFIENDKHCCATLKKNHPDVTVECDDMTDLSLLNYAADEIDLLCGGVPCQSFSISGKRLGLDDKRGQLFYEFVRMVKEAKPKVFLIENVKGLTNHEKGETFELLLDLLTIENKYTVTWKILNSYDYEVPQKRERVFIIGVKKGFGNFNFPAPLPEDRVVLKDVLEDCPESEGVEYSDKKKAVLDLVPPGGCWIDLPLKIQKEYMGKSFLSGGGKRGIAKRLHMDQPCLTLTTSPCQKQTERCHPLVTRPLQVREYARIQTFPDDYEFEGSINQQYKQIGNAVPVKLAYHVGLALRKLWDD